MNAPALNLEPLPREPFEVATERVNAWRGRCVDAFTRAETSVTECLDVLAQVEGRGGQVTLPHLVGQRLEALAATISAGGPFEAEAGNLLGTLERWRSHTDFRNMLCHGVCKITLDLQGRWTVVFRLVTFRSSHLSREALPLAEAEAEALCESVIRASHNLCSQIGQLKARLR
ncbi:hypothetical protein P1X14_04005 [Sphingomonas sp. AOB5]|uniref:hypothetical protein n=1 Tax=Sphingomonas sp. AOB5 TaxID=3034017 RepID=UPI0023FA020C|nr:hypothetical protein [Sphingomonas sp. AOB5]MDF7774400.1 hypothetical protein [Sphingomonas sp. AOB5]